MDEQEISRREKALRTWFTRNADPLLAQVDGLDIGWGGVQRWATAHMSRPLDGLHLDFACGYATFLAQLGWRFPHVHLVGLNIDFCGPHAIARTLLERAQVSAELVQGDARKMPFTSDSFSSVSCFLGLQDIHIGYSQEGIRSAIAEGTRVLRPNGSITLIDEFSFEQMDTFMVGLPVEVIRQELRSLNVQWTRAIAERAISLYAHGWIAQTNISEPSEKQRAYEVIHNRMQTEMERQLQAQGYYVPFGPLRIVIAKKKAYNVQ